MSTIMIDTGANVSLIDITELNRIQKSCKQIIPTLPITNVILVGATGRQNKSVKKQVYLDLKSKSDVIQMVFLVASGLPFSILVGCDMLRQYSAIIDLRREKISLTSNGIVWTAEIIGSQSAPQNRASYHVRENKFYRNNTPKEGVRYLNENREQWQSKLNDIREFQQRRNGTKLSDNQIEQLILIYNKYQHIFSEAPGKVKGFQCKLRFNEPIEFRRKSYPIAYGLKEAVKTEINRMLADDIIEYSQSPYTNPIVAIPKKNGQVRLCLDAREINKAIINDRTSPGEVEEILKRFHGTKFISSWDTVCGYWQVELHPDSRQYVAFIFDGRNYQFKRLPFGLVNSVAIFVHCMDQILGQEILQFTTVYVDDILITSSNWEEHCYRIDQVLKKLSDNNVTLKLEKSKFIANEVQFLGFILSESGISPSPDKVEAIQHFPTPKNKKQLQSFLGICNYYRKFRRNYSELTAKFQPQLSSKDKWTWGPEQDMTLNSIKEKFLESVMLHHPDFNRPFFLNCDASNVSLGAELYQEDGEGNHMVVSFASRVLNSCERNYNVTEKELLSVVFACNKFRTYILGYPVTVRSDHKSISFLKRCKLSHGRLTRWVMVLQEYDINWEYIPGKKNIAADILSRINLNQQTFEGEKDEIMKVYNIIKARADLETIILKIKQEQNTDSKLRELKQRLTEGDDKIIPYYCINDDILFIRTKSNLNTWKVVVPRAVEKELALDYHVRYGHMGALKVIKALEEHIYMKNMNKRVRNYIRNCHICQLVKCNNERKEGAMIPITSNSKLEKVFLDICGPFPRSGGRHRYKFILIMVDHFTKYTNLFPLTRATTRKILEIILNQYVPKLGKPKSIITDHGTQFKGKKWRDTLLSKGIKTYKTSVYHPSSNPAERVLREVGRILRTYCFNDQKRWSDYLKSTEVFINLAYHQTTETTPYTLMHNQPPVREIRELINFPEQMQYQFDTMKFYTKIMEKTRSKRDKYQKMCPKIISYKIGEKVLLKNRELPSKMDGIAKKLLLLYTGPYIIKQDKFNNTYEIMDPNQKKIKGTYNQASLKKYYEERELK